MAGQTRLERVGDLAARAGSLQPADPNLRRGLHIALAAVVGLGVGLAIFGSIGELQGIDWRFRPGALAFSLAALALGQLACAEIWRRILLALGPELEPRRAWAIWCTSGLGRYVPTSLLLPMLRAAMSQRAGVPKRICLASVVYEVALVLVAISLLAAYFAIDLPELSGDARRYAVLALPVLGLVVLQPGIFHPAADWVFERLGRDPLPLSLPGRKMLEFVAMYAVTSLVLGLSVYAAAQTVFPVGAGDVVITVGAYAVGTALGFAAFVLPAGAVAREAGIALALASVMPAAPAVAIAVLWRILQIAVELVLAIVTPLLARGPNPS